MMYTKNATNTPPTTEIMSRIDGFNTATITAVTKTKTLTAHRSVDVEKRAAKFGATLRTRYAVPSSVPSKWPK